MLRSESLLLGGRALLTVGGHGRDVGGETFLHCAISLGCQLNQSMQRHLHPGRLFLADVLEVGVDATEDSLVSDDEDVVGTLELHDDGFEADDNVAVRLPTPVAVVVLVRVALLEVFRVLLLDLLISQSVTHPRIDLVQSFPLALVKHDEETTGLDRALERRRPDSQLSAVPHGLAQEIWQGLSISLAALREIGISAKLAIEVVLGFAMLQ